MRFLLDTDTCIYALKTFNPSLIKKFVANEGQLATSSVVMHELYYGAFGYSEPRKRLSLIDELALRLEVLPFDHASALIAGELRFNLRKSGQQIGSYDVLIAAAALANKLTLITGNTSEFSRIKGLSHENWLS